MRHLEDDNEEEAPKQCPRCGQFWNEFHACPTVSTCEYCGEVDHAVSDCTALADWRHDQDLQDMAAEAAYYQVPKGALEK